MSHPNPVFGLKYHVLRILLMLTGICFRRYGSNITQSKMERFGRMLIAILYIVLGMKLKIITEILMICLAIYVNVCFFLKSLPETEYVRSDIVRTLIFVIWMSYAVVTMVCFG